MFVPLVRDPLKLTKVGGAEEKASAWHAALQLLHVLPHASVDANAALAPNFLADGFESVDGPQFDLFTLLFRPGMTALFRREASSVSSQSEDLVTSNFVRKCYHHTVICTVRSMSPLEDSLHFRYLFSWRYKVHGGLSRFPANIRGLTNSTWGTLALRLIPGQSQTD